jgi:hypothetical protein
MRQISVFKEQNEIISLCGIYCHCYFAAAIVMVWLVYRRRGNKTPRTIGLSFQTPLKEN